MIYKVLKCVRFQGENISCPDTISRARLTEGGVSDKAIDNMLASGFIEVTEGAEKPVERPVSATHTSLWTLDPGALEDKSLEVLNLMVKERDPGHTGYETSEEAIARLSMDYGEET